MYITSVCESRYINVPEVTLFSVLKGIISGFKMVEISKSFKSWLVINVKLKELEQRVNVSEIVKSMGKYYFT